MTARSAFASAVFAASRSRSAATFASRRRLGGLGRLEGCLQRRDRGLGLLERLRTAPGARSDDPAGQLVTARRAAAAS